MPVALDDLGRTAEELNSGFSWGRLNERSSLLFENLPIIDGSFLRMCLIVLIFINLFRIKLISINIKIVSKWR